MKVAILGCGPTGLLAAYGAESAGVEVEIAIFSRARKSQLFGCQYLHSCPPGLKLNGTWVNYEMVGNADGYRSKVYDDSEVQVSPVLLDHEHPAWDIRQAYDLLWDRYEPAIHDYFFSHGTWLGLRNDLVHKEKFDLIINSMPAPVLCAELPGCTFDSATAFALGDAPELGKMVDLPMTVPNNTVVCNGRSEDPWYRISKVFNRATMEWPGTHFSARGARITKPISTTCQCNPGVVRVGRYGTWTKGVLADSAYQTALLEVAARG